MSEPDFVLKKTCNERHSNTKTRLAILTSLVLAAVGVPCVATGIAWSARSKAEAVEVKHDAQAEFLQTTLTEIKTDVREIRNVQTQMLRTGGGD